MKIDVFHYAWSARGGAEEVAAEIVRCLIGWGHDVRVVTISDSDLIHDFIGNEYAFSVKTVDVSKLAKRFNFVHILLFNYRLKRLRSDAALAINTYSEDFGCLGSPVRAYYVHFPIFPKNVLDHMRLRGRVRLDTISLLTWCFTLFLGILHFIPRRYLENVMTNSHWTASIISKNYDVRNLTVVFPPVRTVDLPEAKIDRAARGPQYNFVSIGRLVAEKRIPWIMERLDALGRRHGVNVYYTVIGRSADAYADSIKLLASRFSNLTLELILNASEEEKLRTMNSASFGVHAFRTEHFGMSIAEMMAVGLPVLAVADGGQKDLVADGRLLYSDDQEFDERIDALMGLSTEDYGAIRRDSLLKVSYMSNAHFASALSDFLERASVRV